MSSARLNLRDQARELAEEIQVPIVQLPQRPATPPPMPDDKDKRPETPAVSTVSEVEAELPEDEPAGTGKGGNSIVAPTPTGRPRTARRVVDRSADTSTEGVEKSIVDLSSDGVDLASLSVRIPRRVRRELDRQVYRLKMEGKKIKLEDVVTAALVLFLRIDAEG